MLKRFSAGTSSRNRSIKWRFSDF